ncbi:helix-hairpin-helix domain-containing protein [Suttonella sp. R2A3]|uniref:ComEA family DNA-binding protein n=1 Tax=Suttonella sp. R2A3 TaxID=2908648 RepID=UPI001F1DB397|nr:helix-hairpin-helix domain-containing protein [Suttonella sp. R2A3]UJF24669.1 helix-hairpin-helix domain-containing protein [Suttonella sp. R2A3]
MKLKKLLILFVALLLSAASLAKVNINTANVDELSALSGIGEAKAMAIIDYREANGDFSAVDELVNVKGIGQGTLDKLKDDLSVTGKTDLSDVEHLSQ